MTAVVLFSVAMLFLAPLLSIFGAMFFRRPIGKWALRVNAILFLLADSSQLWTSWWRTQSGCTYSKGFGWRCPEPNFLIELANWHDFAFFLASGYAATVFPLVFIALLIGEIVEARLKDRAL